MTPDEMKENEIARGKQIANEGIQRRHFLATPMISSQSATEIAGQIYVQVLVEWVGSWEYLACQ